MEAAGHRSNQYIGRYINPNEDEKPRPSTDCPKLMIYGTLPDAGEWILVGQFDGPVRRMAYGFWESPAWRSSYPQRGTWQRLGQSALGRGALLQLVASLWPRAHPHGSIGENAAGLPHPGLCVNLPGLLVTLISPPFRGQTRSVSEGDGQSLADASALVSRRRLGETVI